MNPADLALLRIPSDPTLTPDGAVAAVAVTRLDLDADAYRSAIWVVPVDGSAPPRRLTEGPRDTSPRFSPDGHWLAFLRTEDDQTPQLYVMPTDGGEPRQVCEHPLGVSALAWSPDSTRLAYCARVPDPGRYDPDRPAAKEPPRRITTFQYRLDGLGYTIDRRSHVFVVDLLAEEEPVQVTRGDFEHLAPAWHPDGQRLVFTAARHDSWDEDLRTDVFVVEADGGEPERLTDTRWPVADPAFSPDGETLVFASQGDPDPLGRPARLFAMPASGGEPRRLTDPERHDVRSFQIAWAPLLVDDEAVTTINQTRGAVHLVRFRLDGAEPEVMIGGDRWVSGYDVADGTLAAVVADGTSAGELVVVRDGAERVLSDFGADLAETVDLRPPVELGAAADDGYPVHGWVVKPQGPGPHPVILSIHGGPYAQYGHVLLDEVQVLAGAGYAVVLANPRGSSGYGETHGRAVVGRLGDRDSADLLALLDAALTDPELDGARVGVMGGSYGGLMTTWLAAHHGERFTAAISERSLNAPDSFLGTSDIGWHFIDRYFGTDPTRVAAQSPLAHADSIDIPMLIIHAEEDWRCPLEQAQRLYVALKRRGVPTELLLFPGEGHELSRSGLPSHRVARFDAILEWWARWMPVDR